MAWFFFWHSVSTVRRCEKTLLPCERNWTVSLTKMLFSWIKVRQTIRLEVTEVLHACPRARTKVKQHKRVARRKLNKTKRDPRIFEPREEDSLCCVAQHTLALYRLANLSGECLVCSSICQLNKWRAEVYRYLWRKSWTCSGGGEERRIQSLQNIFHKLQNIYIYFTIFFANFNLNFLRSSTRWAASQTTNTIQ